MTESGVHHCDDQESRINALREVLSRAEQELLFYAPRLNGRLIEDAAVQQPLQNFLLASPRHSLRILVVDAAALVRDCPRLVDLCRRLPSRCLLRVPSPRAEPLDEELYCADRYNALHRPLNERSLYLHLADQPLKVSPLRQRVEDLWDGSHESPEFRQLSL
jgi:hypothetical protein